MLRSDREALPDEDLFRNVAVSSRWLRGVGIVFAVLVLLAVAVLRPGAWLVAIGVTVALVVTAAAGWRGRSLRLVVLGLGVLLAGVDYFTWRLSVISWSAFYIAVPLVLAELHALAHNIGLHLGLMPRRVASLSHDQDPSTVPVFVFVPTVDEGPEIVGETLRGILQARETYLRTHPQAVIRVVVCNDGGVAGAACSNDIEALAAELGVECVTRTVPGGAKAGNVENARQLVGGVGRCFLAIFDADQVPEPDFFQVTLAPMRDAEVGWVQTGQFYRNRKNRVAQWADDQQSLFYRLLCPAKSVSDAAFICGTNVVIRGEALDEIGGFPTDSVTEDFAASILLAPRWRSVYVKGIHATGLGPVTFRSYVKQQERWARGTLTALRTHWKQILLPFHGGLSAVQRAQYGLAMTHYLCGLRDLVFLLVPLLFVLGGLNGVQGSTLTEFLNHFVPYYGLAMVAFIHATWGTSTWRSVVIGFASGPALLRATVMTITGRRGIFTLTPKQGSSDGFWRNAAPFVLGLVLCLVSLMVSLTRASDPNHWVAAAWLVYFAAMFVVVLRLVWDDARGKPAVVPPRRRRRRRWPMVAVPVVTVTLLAAGLLWWRAEPPVVAGLPPATDARSFRVGLTGAADAQLDQLRQEGAGDLTGHTFEIADDPTGWLQAQPDGAVPWITLVFSDAGAATARSRLTAISNGVHDADLHRWGRQLAQSRRPVYLTVLPQVDRNYPVTSGVTNGDIPADTPRAWSRIRRLLHSAGATNVALVWQPAEVTLDPAFRPPSEEIDAVGVTVFGYPGTAWPSAQQLVAQVEQTCPGKPILLDVAAKGVSTTGADRAALLRDIGLVARTSPQVAGLAYRLSGPEADATSPEAQSWSLLDDPAALGVVAGLDRSR